MKDHPSDILQLSRPAHDSRMNLWNRAGESISLHDSFFGQAIVLTLGGPSLAHSDLDALRASGIATMGVNNSWAAYRPDFWISVDPASTFSNEGWADPRIRKFAPASEMLTRLRAKRDDGSFRVLGKTPAGSPNTLFFKRGLGFVPEEFLNGAVPTIGVSEGSRCSIGVSGCRSVIFAAIRMAHYLGFRRVYLLGADFNMESEGVQYASGESCGNRHSRGNSKAYPIISQRLRELRPILESAGMSVVNITDGSGLDAFDFERAEDVYARERVQGPEGTDSVGWYQRHNPIRSSEIALSLSRDGGGYSNWHQRLYMLAASLISSEGSSVLDIGAGCGLGMRMLRAGGGVGKWTGIDLEGDEFDDGSDQMMRGDFLDLYSSGSIEKADHVWAIELIKYISGNPAPFLNAIFDRCNISAILTSSHSRTRERFSREEWCIMLEKAGFEVFQSELDGIDVYICSKPKRVEQ